MVTDIPEQAVYTNLRGNVVSPPRGILRDRLGTPGIIGYNGVREYGQKKA